MPESLTDADSIIVGQPRFPHGYAPTIPAPSGRQASRAYLEIDDDNEGEQFDYERHRPENTHDTATWNNLPAMNVCCTPFLAILFFYANSSY